jgi:hypothetical protein
MSGENQDANPREVDFPRAKAPLRTYDCDVHLI